MKIEEIIKREDGTRVRINVSIDTYRDKLSYEFYVHYCEKGKRTWKSPHSSDDHVWRSLDMKDRQEYKKEKYFKIATPLEVHSIAMKLWKSIEPSDNFTVSAY